jgi:hypothetical protein
MSTARIPDHGDGAQERTDSWYDSRREQMRRFRDLPLAEKVMAVEEMERLAKVLRAAVKKGS